MEALKIVHDLADAYVDRDYAGNDYHEISRYEAALIVIAKTIERMEKHT